MAGVGTMRYRTFVLYNLIGAAPGESASPPSATSARWIVVKNNIEIAIIAIVAVSLLP